MRLQENGVVRIGSMMPALRVRLVLALLVAIAPLGGDCRDGDLAVGYDMGIGPDAARAGARLESVLFVREKSPAARWTVSLEAGLSHWSATGRGRGAAWQVSAVPFVRFWKERFYAEFGIGIGFFSHSSLGRQDLGSSFQFCDHIGFGYGLEQDRRLGFRLSHFSNARLARPNDGLDLVQMVYTRAL